MSDLPQPIYPTPGSGQGEGPSSRPYGSNPSGPPPGAPPPTWSVGPPGGPGGGRPSGPRISTQMVLGVAGVVVAVVAAGIYVATRPDPTKGPTNRPPGASAPAGNGAAGNGAAGDAQVQARVEKLTAGLFESQPAASSVTCVKQGLAQDVALLTAIEPTAPDVRLQSDGDAGRYGALLAGCLSPDELNEEVAQSLTEVLDQPSLSCIRATFGSYRSEDWAPFVTAVVQPSRASEVESLLTQALTACGLAG